MTAPDPRLIRQASLEVCRNDFFGFVWKVFATLHTAPSSKFVPAWHVRAMCHELDNVRIGENKRLVITIPPRCLKSITVAVAYVAYILGHFPEAKIIVASYGLDLARKHSDDCRRVMSSRWYREAFPNTRLAKKGNTSEEIRTTFGGGRKAVSIGSSVTGHGADYIIIDDLMKAGDANSEAELLTAQEFVDGTLISRFDNPAEGRVIMIAQRLHELDPPGHLLTKGNYRHLNLKAIAEEDEAVAIGQGRIHLRKKGEPLFPERLGVEVLEEKRRDMGTALFNCQYQQNPVAPDGSPLRWEWFGTYDEAPTRNAFEMIVQSWDTGTSADPNSAFSVCTTWGFRDRKWWLLDLFRDQLDYPQLKRTCFRLQSKWEADVVLIEDASSGRQLLQECHEQNRAVFRRVRPENDKDTRFLTSCAPVEEGKVLLPRQAPWLAAFKHELLGFPRATKRDQVDSFSQFLNWTTGAGLRRALGRDHPTNVERRERINEMRRRRHSNLT